MDVRSISNDYYFQKMDLLNVSIVDFICKYVTVIYIHVWAYILKNLQYTVAGNCN